MPFKAGGCSESQDLEDFGRMVSCGHVHLVVQSSGKYVFVSGILEQGPPTSMAVLEVLS